MEHLSDLIAIAYSDQAAAERARGHLPELVDEGLVELEDVVVLVRGEDVRSMSVREVAGSERRRPAVRCGVG
jgi:uncharacterized membrane protein